MKGRLKPLAYFAAAICVAAVFIVFGAKANAVGATPDITLVRLKMPSSDTCAQILINAETPVMIAGVGEGEDALVSVTRFSCALGADFDYSKNTNTLTVKAEGLTMTVRAGDKYIFANGRYIYTPESVQSYENLLLVPLRSLCRAFGCEITVDLKSGSICVTPTGKPISAADAPYSADDLYWLSRIIKAESGHEPFEGMIAVGNVVMNRVASSKYPNTVYGVIFDNRSGIQFSPAYSGSIYNTPSETHIAAAALALEGVEIFDQAVLFFHPSATCWASKSRPYAGQIGGHYFWS